MELKVKSETSEPLYSRKIVELHATFEGATPSKDKFKEKAAKTIGAEANLIVVKKIATLFGKQEADCTFYVYESEAALKQLEGETDGKEKAEG
ncbi:MAG: hypothetical protein R6V53_04225 [Candidatus Woesearchaeota archaeon]